MDKRCGQLTVGEASPGRAGAAATIREIRIGDAILNQARCDPTLLRQLTSGQDACVYVFWHFHIWPVVLGVTYPDGSKYLASPSWVRTSVMQYATMLAIIAAFAGGVAGEIVGAVTGIGTFLGGVGFAAGLVDSWWGAVRLKRDYAQAEND